MSGSGDSTLRLWNLGDGRCTRVLKGHTATVCAVTPLGEERVVSGAADRMMSVWRTEDGVCERVLSGHNGSVWAVAVVNVEISTRGPGVLFAQVAPPRADDGGVDDED